jgi:hypothetical protein
LNGNFQGMFDFPASWRAHCQSFLTARVTLSV